MLYDQLEPFADVRGDLQAGIIASAVANFSGRLSRGATPLDFMPFAEKIVKTEVQTAEELHAAFLAFKMSRENQQLD